jgi:hypothetical protein
LAGGVILQLISLQVFQKNAGAVDEGKDRERATERSKNNQPGPQPPLGEVVFAIEAGHGQGAGIRSARWPEGLLVVGSFMTFFSNLADLAIHRGLFGIVRHNQWGAKCNIAIAISRVVFYKAAVLCYSINPNSLHSLHQNGICEL